SGGRAGSPGCGLVAFVATRIVAACVLITSLVLHEVGLSIVGRWIGLTPRHISLSLFGGLTVFDREPGTPGQAWALALAGPVANLLVAEIGRAHVELQSRFDLVCRLLLEKKKTKSEVLIA